MPSSPNYKRNYKQEAATESPERKKARRERNRARYQLMKQGKVKKGDGKEVDHKVPLSYGGSNSPRNLRVRPASANHSYQRNSKGGMKYRDQR